MTNKTKTRPKPKTNQAKKKARYKAINRAVAISVTLIGIIMLALLIKSHGTGSRNLVKLNTDVAYGIDVSHHNGKIDWSEVKSEVDFAFIRVGYRGYDDGGIHSDKKAKANLKGANENGVPIGVYFYSQAISEAEAEEEAKFLISKIKDYDISLPVAIDFEYAAKNGENIGRLYEANLSKKEITSLVNAFCKKIKDAGYTPAVYASSYIFRFHLNAKKLDEQTMIWVADYNENVTYHGDYDFWQFSEKGKCKGVSSKYVDTNYWYIEKEDYN